MKLRSLFTAIIIGCVGAATLNSLGWLQIYERRLYDFYLRLRPSETLESNIIIVGLNESDIEQFGFPLDDLQLATLLTKIKQQNPRVIGLDLHRNVSIGTQGKEELETIFSSTPQLIGVEKTDGGNPNHESISPPETLAKLGQTGASEIIEDSESGIVRRGYLYVQRSQSKEALPSFALAVALKYLEAEKIVPTGEKKTSWLKLGNAVFPLLRSNRLFYRDRATPRQERDRDIDNYQTLVNYRSASNSFLQVSITEVIKDRIADNLFQDKIVLIGTTAETIKDIYTTPNDYDAGNFGFTYGVKIHAHLASQIINSALNNRTIIKFLPASLEYSAILILVVTTSFVSWYLAKKMIFSSKIKPFIPIINISSSTIIIFFAGYLLLLSGWWIPTATILLAIVFSQATIYLYIRLEQLQQANLILEEKIKLKTQELAAAQQKILAQEKSALYQKLSQYVAHEIKNKTNIMGLNIQNSHTDLAELQLIIEDNAFLFEDIVEPETRSPNELIIDLQYKLSRIEQINQKVTSIINEIYRQGEKERIISAIDLNRLIERILLDTLQVYHSKGEGLEIKINRQYESNIPLINAVASDLERALENIIDNALYYLAQKKHQLPEYIPTLSISTQNKDGQVEIRIKDNGIGIAKENLDKIFTMFWTTKASGKSMGIGLHFAKELIEKNCGKILVSSQQNEYTEFIITLNKT